MTEVCRRVGRGEASDRTFFKGLSLTGECGGLEASDRTSLD